VNTANTVTYLYDADDLFDGTSGLATFTVTRGYASYYGLVTGTTLGGVSDTTGYDGFGELSSYTATYGSTTLYSLSNVVRDQNGRFQSMTETISGHSNETNLWSFTYDVRGRLTQANRAGAVNNYCYDVNGNRTSLNAASCAVTPTWTYDSQDRFLSSTGTPAITNTYTNDGKETTKVVSGTGGGTYT